MNKDKLNKVAKQVSNITTIVKEKDIRNKPEDFIGGIAGIFEAVIDMLEALKDR